MNLVKSKVHKHSNENSWRDFDYCKFFWRLLLYEWIKFYSNSIKRCQFLYKKQKEYIFWWSHSIPTFRTTKLVKFNQITPVFVQKPKKVMSFTKPVFLYRYLPLIFFFFKIQFDPNFFCWSHTKTNANI